MRFTGVSKNAYFHAYAIFEDIENINNYDQWIRHNWFSENMRFKYTFNQIFTKPEVITPTSGGQKYFKLLSLNSPYLIQ